MSTSVTLLSVLRATDERAAAEVAGRLEVLERTVPTEPGNLAYAVYRTAEDRTAFYIEESWSAPEDVARHADRIADDTNAEESAALLAGPIQTVTLLALHTATSETTTTRPDHHGGSA